MRTELQRRIDCMVSGKFYGIGTSNSAIRYANEGERLQAYLMFQDLLDKKITDADTGYPYAVEDVTSEYRARQMQPVTEPATMYKPAA
jgi:hypothetical protein